MERSAICTAGLAGRPNTVRAIGNPWSGTRWRPSTSTLWWLGNRGRLKPVHFEDLVEGHVGESSEVFADRDDMVAYAERNDPYPIHVDEQFAATSPFGGLVASFGYTVSLYLRIIHDMELFRATGSTFMGVLEWRSRFAARSARRPPTRPRDDIEQAAREQGQRGA
jgi:hypothetical protein